MSDISEIVERQPTLKRAYSDEQKHQRQLEMCQAAKLLLKERRYENVTMNDIAEICGVSKGTLYVYFRTKEALFLTYAEQEINEFFSLLHETLAQQPNGAGIDCVLHSLGSIYSQKSEFGRLLALLHTVLESKVDLDTALSFRRMLKPLLESTGEEFERHLRFLSPGEGSRLLLSIHAISLGFQQLSNPSPVMKQVEDEPDMALYRFDFSRDFLSTIKMLLLGIETQAETG